MTDPRPRSRSIPRLLRRKLFWAVVSVPLVIAAISGWLTADLEPPSTSVSTTPKTHPIGSVRPARVVKWPTAPIRGREAMLLLRDSLLVARDRLEAANGFTAVLHKKERLKGVLGDEQVLEMKSRVRPFSVYFKYRTPESGKEIVYAEGRYDNHLIAHGTGISRALIPRLKVAPDSAIALAGNRHPITDAGVMNLTKKLIGYRELDLRDPEAETVLDRVTDKDGREWLRSVHTHPRHKPDRPFQVVEVFYDSKTLIPHEIRNYDWLAPGETGEPKLAETYRYEDLRLGAELTDLDFDPANPAYAFSRY